MSTQHADFGHWIPVQPIPPQPTSVRGRTGLVIVASALSALIGAGAGVGSYSMLSAPLPASTITV
ncbi:MAG: hypothetical protein WAS07_07075, partial [Micropruina sp.]